MLLNFWWSFLIIMHCILTAARDPGRVTMKKTTFKEEHHSHNMTLVDSTYGTWWNVQLSLFLVTIFLTPAPANQNFYFSHHVALLCHNTCSRCCICWDTCVGMLNRSDVTSLYTINSVIWRLSSSCPRRLHFPQQRIMQKLYLLVLHTCGGKTNAMWFSVSSFTQSFDACSSWSWDLLESSRCTLRNNAKCKN